jgi:hypothetical protein
MKGEGFETEHPALARGIETEHPALARGIETEHPALARGIEIRDDAWGFTLRGNNWVGCLLCADDYKSLLYDVRSPLLLRSHKRPKSKH